MTGSVSSSADATMMRSAAPRAIRRWAHQRTANGPVPPAQIVAVGPFNWWRTPTWPGAAFMTVLGKYLALPEPVLMSPPMNASTGVTGPEPVANMSPVALVSSNVSPRAFRISATASSARRLSGSIRRMYWGLMPRWVFLAGTPAPRNGGMSSIAIVEEP